MNLQDKAFMAKFNALCESVAKIEERTKDVAKIGEICAKLESRMEKVGEELKAVQDVSAANTKAIQGLRKEVGKLRPKVFDNDQYSRKPNVIVRGIPEKRPGEQNQKENTKELIQILASRLGAQLHDYDVCAVHRLYRRDDDDSTTVAPIVVRLNSFDKKHELMSLSKKKKLNSSMIGLGGNMPIFVDEHLTRETLALLHAAKCAKWKGFIEDAWCRDGKIFIREVAGGPTRRIGDTTYLESLGLDINEVQSQRSKNRANKPKRTVDMRSPESVEYQTDSDGSEFRGSEKDDEARNGNVKKRSRSTNSTTANGTNNWRGKWKNGKHRENLQFKDSAETAT